MISASDRENAVLLINEAIASGASCKKACYRLGITERTFYRWKKRKSDINSYEDGRPTADHSDPANKIPTETRKEIINICNKPEYASMAPCEIVPTLADEGIYIASESTFYRVLREEKMLNHRGRSEAPKHNRPSTYSATAPNQVYMWDITYLNGPHKGMFYYLYLFSDLYDQSIVGWEVYEAENADYASSLIKRICLKQGRLTTEPLVLHSDNGSPMKGATMLATLYQLGITPSNSRPRVSNDNPYAESLFKTLKYRPNYQPKGVATLEEAREWVSLFVKWYNHDHHHSGLKFLTPYQRRSGLSDKILAKRKEVYEAAKTEHPERWNGRSPRDWSLPDTVYLNPEKISEEAETAVEETAVS